MCDQEIDRGRVLEEIIGFAEQHQLTIHPRIDLERHVDRVLRHKGHCPCDPIRPKCPCPESLDELLTDKGTCCCTFFVSTRYLERWGYLTLH